MEAVDEVDMCEIVLSESESESMGEAGSEESEAGEAGEIGGLGVSGEKGADEVERGE